MQAALRTVYRDSYCEIHKSHYANSCLGNLLKQKSYFLPNCTFYLFSERKENKLFVCDGLLTL